MKYWHPAISPFAAILTREFQLLLPMGTHNIEFFLLFLSMCIVHYAHVYSVLATELSPKQNRSIYETTRSYDSS